MLQNTTVMKSRPLEPAISPKAVTSSAPSSRATRRRAVPRDSERMASISRTA